MNVNDLFPSKYLKAHDLGGKAFTLTIRAATLEELGYGAEKERKLALAFDGATKLMLLNRTNAMIIASMYGPETNGWIGKAITAYSARIKAFGQWHDALRIKEQVPARNVGAAKMPDAMVEAPPIDDEEDLLDVDEGNDSSPDGSGGDSDNNLWEPTGPERASNGQLEELHMLGKAHYGDGWDAKLPKLVEGITTGTTSAPAQLTPTECERLIKGIQSRQAAAVQSTNGKVPSRLALSEANVTGKATAGTK